MLSVQLIRKSEDLFVSIRFHAKVRNVDLNPRWTIERVVNDDQSTRMDKLSWYTRISVCIRL